MSVQSRAKLDRERRHFVGTTIEVREGDGGTGVSFDGIASTVDNPYTVRDAFGEFTETIAEGAFTKTLNDNADVRLLVDHNGVPLARTKSHTLRLTAKPDLRAQAELDSSSPLVQTVRSAMSRGDLDQMSIGFRVHRQEWNEDYTDRTIRELELFDVSIVTFPANPNTSASLRALVHGPVPETAEELRAAISRLNDALRQIEPANDPDPEPVEGTPGLDEWYDKLRTRLEALQPA